MKTFGSAAGRVVAVEHVSLQLRAGARLGLVGPSGSGKSTLAQVMALLLKPDSGSVTIDGDRVSSWGVRCERGLRHRVQLVWQSPRMAVDPRLRVGDAIVEPWPPAGCCPPAASERAALIASWAVRVGLTQELLGRSLTRCPKVSSNAHVSRARSSLLLAI